MKAQGNALGPEHNNAQALKGRNMPPSLSMNLVYLEFVKWCGLSSPTKKGRASKDAPLDFDE